MIVLDTNVVSERMRPDPAAAVVEWVDLQPADEVWLTAITLAELLFGIGRLPDGRRKRAVAAQVEAMVEEDFDHRIGAFDEIAATHYADIVVCRQRADRPISMPDAQIAAICRSHRATLATRNLADFADTGVTTVNPWSDPRTT